MITYAQAVISLVGEKFIGGPTDAIGLGEQLDMIYHDMDKWKTRIKSIKDKFPKPE